MIFKTRELEDLARKGDGQKQLGKYFQRAQVKECYKIFSIVLTDDISFEDMLCVSQLINNTCLTD